MYGGMDFFSGLHALLVSLETEVSEGTYVFEEGFLVRQNQVDKVQTTYVAYPEGIHMDKRSNIAAIQKTIDTVKTEFEDEAQNS